MHSRRAQNFLALLFAAFAVLAAPAARADALDGVLEVRSAYVSRRAGRAAVVRARGLSRERRHSRGAQGWTDADLRPGRGGDRASGASGWTRPSGSTSCRRELSYHAVSDKYLTRDVDPRSGSEQHSYASLEEALEALGTVDAYPLLTTSQLSAESPIPRVSLRAGVRRGRLSDTLRVMLFWTDDWHRESEWFSWSLQR